MTPEDTRRIELAYEQVLNVVSPGWADTDALKGTPTRVARWWTEFVDYDPGNIDVTFNSFEADQMVAVTGVTVWSLCEHHLLPFSSQVTIAYVAKGKVVGLSKMARMAHKHAHKLQLQERLVKDIGDELAVVTGVVDVAVVAQGRHLCQEMRGIKTPATMHTSYLQGSFRDDPKTREEFMQLVLQRGTQ